MTATARALLVTMVAFACGERRVLDDELAPPPSRDAGAGESEGASAGEVTCREGLAACAGECVDLSSSDEHCGACGHECLGAFIWGHCAEGACASTFMCAGIEQVPRSCDDVCALHGQRCDAEPSSFRGCGGAGYQLHFDELGRKALDLCERDLGSFQPVHAPCSAPIDWSIHGGWGSNPAGAVACCCTQELEP